MRVVRGVNLQIAPAEVLGLVGESGSGKSTVGRAIVGLEPIASGHIEVAGMDVGSARGRNLRALRRCVQIVFQDPGASLDPRLRVGTSVAEPLIVHDEYRRQPRRVPVGEWLRGEVASLLEMCGMPADAAARYPHEFSGGQKQRIAIARALALKPQLVVCDEPTSALDVSVQAQIINLLMELRATLGAAYLFISHDMGVISHVCDRIAVMQRGEVVEMGDREAVLHRPSHSYSKNLLHAAGD